MDKKVKVVFKTKSDKCIIVLEATGCDIIQKAINEGAGCYTLKSQDYEALAKKIRKFCGDICFEISEDNNISSNSEGSVNITQKDREIMKIDKEVLSLLNSFSISSSIKGYHFLQAAIKLAVLEPEVMTGITKRVYPDIAKANESSPSKVERAIRHAIETAWKRDGGAVYNEVTGCCYVNKPTNGQFISAIAEYIRNFIVPEIAIRQKRKQSLK